LIAIKNRLEKHFKDMQDIEFTVQQKKLYILQTRNGMRTGASAVKCAVDMVAEKLITKEMAILRLTPANLDQLLHPMIDAVARKSAKALAKGLDASPGAAGGKIVFTANDAEAWHEKGEKVLLVRRETSPEDIGGMHVAQGILTSTGGKTSHAAVVARGMGTPCIVGAKSIGIQDKTMTIGAKTFKEGDWITIDGSTGEVFEGQLPLFTPDKIPKDMETFLGWCDAVCAASRRGNIKGFEIWANADQPEDAKRAFEFGAQGIGLCRTEHMFFGKEKLSHFRAMIVADTVAERKEALKKILPLQQKDFFGIFKAMEGKPVVVRLLDPPLHEFVPHSEAEIAELAQQLKLNTAALKSKIARLHEMNPMLGHRGCRLAVTYPEIYDMQVEAIALAAVECVKQKIPVKPEIMIPLIITDKELAMLRANAQAVLKRVFAQTGIKVPILIGTMIEVPRAALRSANIVEHADFFSFGTNDLTQMTLGFSRDDVSSFMPSYIEQEVLEVDPFMSIDEAAVGFLVSFATHMGRSVKPGLSVGVCGEHGGDPASIEFFYNSELSYVSCSPFRVPIARLAGAQAALKSEAAAKASGKKPAVKKAADKKPAKPKAKKLKAEKPKAEKPKAAKPKDTKPKAEKLKAEKVTAKKAVGKKPAKAKKK